MALKKINIKIYILMLGIVLGTLLINIGDIDFFYLKLNIFKYNNFFDLLIMQSVVVFKYILLCLILYKIAGLKICSKIVYILMGAKIGVLFSIIVLVSEYRFIDCLLLVLFKLVIFEIIFRRHKSINELLVGLTILITFFLLINLIFFIF